MGNPIKYSTSVTSGSYQKGNTAIGVNSINYGPTSTTGWYNSPTPTGGNFIVTEVIDGNTPPRFYAPSTLTDWVNLAKQEGATGANTGSIVAVKNWFASQANYVVTNIDFPSNMPSVVGNGQVTYLDSEFTTSYPGSGTAWNDISGLGNNTTLVNGPTFNAPSKYIQFDGIDDFTSIPNPGDTGSIQFSWYWPGTAQSFITGNLNGYAMLYNGGSGTVIHWYPANGGYDFGGSIPNRAGWYNITLTWGGTNDNKLYFNGALVMSSTAYFISKPPIWYFAAGGSYTAQAIRLQTIQAYNKILTQTEILQNHHKASIITDGLVLALDAGNIISYENGSTTAYNLSGSSASTSGGTLSVDFNGTLTNGTSYSSTAGGTWVFDGVDDFISLPVNSAFNTPSVTYEVWANLQSINDRHILYVNWQGNSLEVYPDRSVVMYNYSSQGQQGAGTSAGVFDWDKWVHFVGIYDDAAQTLKTYINGVLLGTRTSTPSTIYNAGNHKISGTDYGGEVKGNIAIVRHYNKALTDAEVSQNFNAQRSRFGI
jgi:hypothetical protein